MSLAQTLTPKYHFSSFLFYKLYFTKFHWIFELNKIWGELRFFKIKGGRKRGCRGEFLKFSLGGKLLEMKLQTENKFQNEICTSLVGFLTGVF